MEKFIGTDTACDSSPELRHLSYRVTNYFYPYVVEVCRLRLDPLCDTHLRLSVILKTLTGQKYLEV